MQFENHWSYSSFWGMEQLSPIVGLTADKIVLSLGDKAAEMHTKLFFPLVELSK